MFGAFSPGEFLVKIRGTELVSVSGGKDKLMLTDRGKLFADWLIGMKKMPKLLILTKADGVKNNASKMFGKHSKKELKIQFNLLDRHYGLGGSLETR